MLKIRTTIVFITGSVMRTLLKQNLTDEFE